MVGGLISGRVKSKTEQSTSVASLVYIQHIRLEQGWLAWCQYNMTGFICGMVLRCDGKLKPDLSLDQYNRSDTHCHSYKSPKNDVTLIYTKPSLSLRKSGKNKTQQKHNRVNHR